MADNKSASASAKQANKSAKSERTNTGKKGGRKNPQSAEHLIMLGKGLFKSTRVISGPSFAVSAGRIPLDAKQAEINRSLGYW